MPTYSALEDRLLNDPVDESLTAEELNTLSRSKQAITGPIALRIIEHPNCPANVLHTYAGMLLAHPRWLDGMGALVLAPLITEHPNATEATRNRVAKSQGTYTPQQPPHSVDLAE